MSLLLLRSRGVYCLRYVCYSQVRFHIVDFEFQDLVMAIFAWSGLVSGKYICMCVAIKYPCLYK